VYRAKDGGHICSEIKTIVRCNQGLINNLTKRNVIRAVRILKWVLLRLYKSHDEVQHLDKPSDLVSKGCLKIVRPAYDPIQLDVYCTASMSNAFERNPQDTDAQLYTQ